MLISEIAESNGRKYIKHNENICLFYGIQIRLDDAVRAQIEEEKFEEYFKMASYLNFTTVSITVSWKNNIEVCLSGLESKYFENCIKYAEKYHLYIHWLWFGSNVCGCQSSIPDDIRNDKDNYPFYKYNNETVIDVSNQRFINREVLAFRYFLRMISNYDKQKLTQAIQIENEPDYGNWRLQREDRLNLINTLGLEVKKGPYSVITRVNITAPEKYLDEDNLIEELLALPGIDCVGVDIYINNNNYCNKFIDKMSHSSKNLMHFAELGAHVDILPQLICNMLQNCGGCLLYELKTVSKRDYDFGIFRSSPDKWIERDGEKPVQYQWKEGEYVPESNTEDIQILNDMINTARVPLALSSKENISMLLSGQKFCVNGIQVEFNTEQTGYNAFSMCIFSDDGFLYAFTLAKDAEFSFIGITSTTAYVGEKENYNTLVDINNNMLKAKIGKVYKIKI